MSKLITGKKKSTKPMINKREPIFITKQTIIDLMLIDRVSHKNKSWQLLNGEQIDKMIDHFRYLTTDSIRVPFVKYKQPQNDLKFSANIVKLLADDAILMKILELGEGNVSLCGGRIIETRIAKNNWTDFDFFFHGNNNNNMTKNDLTKILTQKLITCLQYFQQNYMHGVIFIRNKGCITMKLGAKTYQFILRLYENVGQVLGGFDLWGSKLGYNLKDGLFGTLHGAFALATGLQSIDLTKRSTTYGTRLHKYLNQKYVGILLPSLDIDKVSIYDCNELNTPDGRFDVPYHFDAINPGKNLQLYYHNLGSDHNHDYESGEFMNWYYFTQNRPEMYAFKGGLNTISKISKNTISDTMDVLQNPNKRAYPLDHKLVDKIFAPYDNALNLGQNDTSGEENKNNTELMKFKVAHYINNDKDTANKIWAEMKNWYLVEIQKYVAINLPEISIENSNVIWKIVDPGAQGFGSNNPIIQNPRDWYGAEFYNPCEVGIPIDIYMILKRARFNGSCWRYINKDLFGIILGKLEIAQAKRVFDSYLFK